MPRLLSCIPLYEAGSGFSLEVMVNGQGPFRFGLDTGASQAACVTRALADRLELPVVEGFRVSDGSGINSRNSDGVRIDTLALGEVTFDQIVGPVLGEGPKGENDPEVYGTLGFGLFADYLVTYDYPGKELRVATGRLPRPDGKAILSYRTDRGSPLIQIEIGRLRVDAMLDTGGIKEVILPLSLAGRLDLKSPLRPVGKMATILNECDLFQSELDGEVRIGEITLRDPALFFAELIHQPALGRDLLHRYALTFDQRKHRVRFESPGAAGAAGQTRCPQRSGRQAD